MTASTRKQIALLLLLIAGILLRLRFPPGEYSIAEGPVTFWLLAIALALGLIPATRNFLIFYLDKIRNPSPRARTIASIAIGVAATAFLILTAFDQGRDCTFPRLHDEHAYLVQTQMLATGRLWITPPADWPADAFETFHVLTKRVYAAVYFPGAAIFFLPTIWLGLPIWFMPVVICGAIVGLMYRVVAELVDGVAGALATIMIVSLGRFRIVSMMLMSHPAEMMLGLVLILAWLIWRREKNWKWAIAIGAAAGWAAITRPLDAICFAAPVGVMMLFDIFFLTPSPGTPGEGGGEGSAQTRKRFSDSEQNPHPNLLPAYRAKGPELLRIASLVLLGAAPFLILQLVFNLGVTGKLALSPYRYNADLSFPQVSYGFHTYDPNLKPATNLPQKIYYHEVSDVPEIKKHRPELVMHNLMETRLPMIFGNTLVSRWLLILLPIGLLATTDRRRLAVVLILPLFIVLYSGWVFFLTHYCLIVMPSMILLVLLGGRAIEETFPKFRATISIAISLAIVILSLHGVPQFNSDVHDDPYSVLEMPSMWIAYNELPQKISKPAVVLFRTHPGVNPHEEPVYNDRAAWTDDEQIIHAHDLGGEKNLELVRYYAKHQPERDFWLFDRAIEGPKYSYLGKAKDIAAKFPGTK